MLFFTYPFNQVPRICPGYQSGSYSIVISDNDGSPIHTFEPLEYTQERENETTLIVREIKTGLNFSEHYKIEVAAMSMGIQRSRRKTFSKPARSQYVMFYSLKMIELCIDTVFDSQLVCTSNSPTDSSAITSSVCLQPGKILIQYYFYWLSFFFIQSYKLGIICWHHCWNSNIPYHLLPVFAIASVPHMPKNEIKPKSVQNAG